MKPRATTNGSEQGSPLRPLLACVRVLWLATRVAGVLCLGWLAVRRFGETEAILLQFVFVACVAALNLLTPRTQVETAPDGANGLTARTWSFRATWVAFWLLVTVWGLLIFWPVCVVIWTGQILLSMWLPILYLRVVTIRMRGQVAFRFLMLGDWWAEGVRFLWLPDGKLLVALCDECGWSRHVLDPGQCQHRGTRRLAHQYLVGRTLAAREDLFDIEPGWQHKPEVDEALEERILSHYAADHADADRESDASFRASLRAFLWRTHGYIPKLKANATPGPRREGRASGC